MIRKNAEGHSPDLGERAKKLHRPMNIAEITSGKQSCFKVSCFNKNNTHCDHSNADK